MKRSDAAVLAVLLVALVCIVGGIALVYLPAGIIAVGLALLGVLTFDPAAARRLTWPR